MADTIHPAILAHYNFLNTDQKKAIGQTDGALLIIAGPGSGKTLVLVIRALNILLQAKCQPREMILCTFTEKAAFELRDRVSQAARNLGYTGDLSQLNVGTIHGICNSYINRYRHHTWLGNSYEVLDELTQALFLFENFDAIVGSGTNGQFLGRYTTRWTAIEGLIKFFNKITEELVDTQGLVESSEPFLNELGLAFQRYENALQARNRIDFAHQQRIFYELLRKEDIAQQVQADARYVMVDEYQDTNYIQEQLILSLAQPQNNLCVVGDDDQSLYRFRGATVRNILEFGKNFDPCPQVRLTVNYRSHRQIIDGYNRFMAGCNWSNPNSQFNFRYAKTITPDLSIEHPDYPAVFSIWGGSEFDEAERAAGLVQSLMQSQTIEDYNQVAILLHSVRLNHSGRYIDALARRSIPAFAPRARGYFENNEVHLLIGCFAVLLGWFDDGRGDIKGFALADLATYVDGCLAEVARNGIVGAQPLARYLQDRFKEVIRLKEGDALDQHLGDYFYRMIAFEPFATMMSNENQARNLAIFSQLIAVFENYYHYTVITHKNRDVLRLHFFNSFLRFLYAGGINEYEDPDQPFPSGYVQLMTIHQSKGLEFPVVIVGSLAVNTSTAKLEDQLLSPFYHRVPFEPQRRITEFDRMRLHYVAFSRAEKLLVLTTTATPKTYFNPIWQGLPQWPFIQQDLLAAQRFTPKKRIPIKKTFSFTNQLKVYETCPRQYQFYRDYEFVPSRSAEIFFGSLVHQTIEDIHRRVLDGQALTLIQTAIPSFFETNFRNLLNRGLRPINDRQRDLAQQQVDSYFLQNQDRMAQVIETEVDVSVEKEGYILTGRIDLLMDDSHELELLDFKSQPRPQKDDRRLQHYYQQLLIYAHILEQRYNRRPARMALYWTGEMRRDDALMVFPYEPDKVAEAGSHFDLVVAQIIGRDYEVRQVPESKVCKECDFRSYCQHTGTISL